MRNFIFLIIFFNVFAFADNFILEGNDLEDIKLTFNSEGLDRSTPELTIKSLIKVKLNLQEDEKKIFKIINCEFNSSKKYFSPLFTENLFNTLIQNNFNEKKDEEKQIQNIKKDFKINIKNKKVNKDNSVEFDINLKIIYSENHSDCKEEGCQHHYPHEKNYEYKAILLKINDIWKIKGLYNTCKVCMGTGKCPYCNKKGIKCHVCLGTMICKHCKGTGLVLDRFLVGPPNYKNLEYMAEKNLKLNNPKDTAESFFYSIKKLDNLTKNMENKFKQAFLNFQDFFMVKEFITENKYNNARKINFEIADEINYDKDKASINFIAVKEKLKDEEIKKMSSYPVETDKIREKKYKLDLVKVDDNWIIDLLSEKCWACDGIGKRKKYTYRDKYICPKHPEIFSFDKNSTCPKCKSKLIEDTSTIEDCKTCKGKGFISINFLPTFR